MARPRQKQSRAGEEPRTRGHLCFDAQQAAEKALKAVLIGRGIEFPYVHDLARLLSLLEEGGETVPAAVRKAATLTPMR